MDINRFDSDNTDINIMGSDINGRSYSVGINVGNLEVSTPAYKIFKCSYKGDLNLDLGAYSYSYGISNLKWKYTVESVIVGDKDTKVLLGDSPLVISEVCSGPYSFMAITPTKGDGNLQHTISACTLWEYLMTPCGDISTFADIRRRAAKVIVFTTGTLDAIAIKDHFIVINSKEINREHVETLADDLRILLNLLRKSDLLAIATSIRLPRE